MATSVPFCNLGEFRVLDLFIPSILPLWGCAKSAGLTFFLLPSIHSLFNNNYSCRWVLAGRAESLGTRSGLRSWPFGQDFWFTKSTSMEMWKKTPTSLEFCFLSRLHILPCLPVHFFFFQHGQEWFSTTVFSSDLSLSGPAAPLFSEGMC